MNKFKFKTLKKEKLNLINDNNDLFGGNILDKSHIELFGNKFVVIEGCKSIEDYKDNYIKLRIKKGNISFTGNDFYIISFDENKIIIKGNIIAVEFCV